MLEHKTILITGATKGIGRALVSRLETQNTVRFALVARSSTLLGELKVHLQKQGHECEVFAGDVAAESFVVSTVQHCIERFGSIDILVNNAGIGKFGEVEQYSLGEWQQLFDTNVTGTFLFSREVVPHMKRQGHGHIVMVASDVSKRVFEGGTAYCATKFAQDAFSMALRKEVRRFGIKVSTIFPGLVDTSFHAQPQGDPAHQGWLSAHDVADAIIYTLNAPSHVVIDELMLHPLLQEY
ncbi:MAG: SDR family oxidoreductase [Brasilonema sp.]